MVFTHGGNQIKEWFFGPKEIEPKVAEIKTIKSKNMANKVLFILPADKLWARVLRRAVVVAVLTFVAILLKDWLMPIAPEVWVAVIGAVLVSLEKMIRDLTTTTEK